MILQAITAITLSVAGPLLLIWWDPAGKRKPKTSTDVHKNPLISPRD